MLNTLVLFFGLLILFIIGKLPLIFQVFVFVILYLLACNKKLSTVHLLIKIKYFLFALVLIYSLTTPGELLFYYSFISISYEGILLAFENLFRIINIFMLIMILFSTLSKDFFVRFLIKICYPFSFIGVNIERLSCRLYLTFEYLEIFKKYQFKYSSITNDIEKQLNSRNIDKLNNKISIIKPDLIDYLMVLIFIMLILFIQYLTP